MAHPPHPPPNGAAEAAALSETSQMLLYYLRVAHAPLLAQQPRPSFKPATPPDELLHYIHDGVLLCRIVSTGAPNSLPASLITLSTPRNALSAPHPHANSHGLLQIDSRQLALQYKSNARRLVAALRRIFDEVRNDARIPLALPGVTEAFVGPGATVPPVRDMRPAVRLAQLVLAADVYGPRSNMCKFAFWSFPEPARRVFHTSLQAVATALALPAPASLYAMSPQPPTPPLMSPVMQSPLMSPRHPIPLHPNQILSPNIPQQPSPYSPHLSPHVTQSPHRLSPRPHHNIVSPRPPLPPQRTAPPPMEAAPPPAYVEGMGGRKISIVTEDSARSTSPQDDPPVTPPPPMYPAANTLYTVPRAQTTDPPRATVSHRVSPSPVQTDTTSYEVESHSRNSEDYYTPMEHTPPPDQYSNSQRHETASVDASDASVSEQYQSPQLTSIPYLPGTKVNETVRQSVTSSITKQISQSAFPSDSDASESANNPTRPRGSPTPSHLRTPTHSVNFRDPNFTFSPTGSEAPSPSNKWQISRQKPIAAEVTSPQQLFSPPSMPVRLSRTAAATQMTPPIAVPPPPLPPQYQNVAPSPHLSMSSNGADMSESEDPQQAKVVTFAPSIISPGGNLRPLGEPLRAAQRDSSRDPKQSKSTDSSFALPPSAGVGKSIASREIEVNPEQSGYPGATQSQEASREVQAAPHVEEGEGHMEDQEYHTDGDDTYSSERGSVGDREDFGIANFGEQDDGVVYNKDGRPEQRRTDRETQLFSPEETRAGMSAVEMSVATESTGDSNPQASIPRQTTSASRPPLHGGPTPRQYSQTQQFLSPIVKPLGYSPVSHDSQHRKDHRLLEIPSTPPTPPNFSELVESFSQNNRSALKPAEPRPVSTMAPSAGLFQKLISVWQSSEEEAREPEARPAAPVVEEKSGLQHFDHQLDGPAALASEFSVPVGATDDSGPVREAVTPDQSLRNRRPRAVRMDSGSPHLPNLPPAANNGSEDGSTKDGAERSSGASFSDDFSMDKDRPWQTQGGNDWEIYDWERALKDDYEPGIPVSASESRRAPKSAAAVPPLTPAAGPSSSDAPRALNSEVQPRSTLPDRQSKSHSISTTNPGMRVEGQHIKVDRSQLDWLTRELLAARDTISRKELQMTFAETQRLEQQEILLLEKQEAESVVVAMQRVLGERELELNEARDRLSYAIEGVADRERVSQSSTSGGETLVTLIKENDKKLHERLDRAEVMADKGPDTQNSEMRRLWVEVKRAMEEKMLEMNEKRDEELSLLRQELQHRQKLVEDLQRSSDQFANRNQALQSEASAVRSEKQQAAYQYELEMAHVTAQMEIVNEFSKKLHDNFRETENLRQQVLQYQEKLSHITSASGISQRQIKELREAVTRANDECARLRREADIAKKRGLEAYRRAEELEELRYKDVAAHNQTRFPDRQDRTETGSYRSHEPVRPAGHNRPGGTGIGTRYHGATRARGNPAAPTPAQKAWVAIKDRIGGIVTGRDGSSSRRRVAGGTRRDQHSRSASRSRSSGSQSRSRGSAPDDELIMPRSHSGSVKSRSTSGSQASSIHSGPPRSNKSGSGGRRATPGESSHQYMHSSPYGQDEVHGIRARDF